MRTYLILGWLLIPVLGWAYHMGPGQDQQRQDDIDHLIRTAAAAQSESKFDAAIEHYSAAIAALPSDAVDTSRQLRLELAKSQMQSAQLPEARAELESLLTELESESNSDAQLIQQTRSALANAQYHMTWLMRLEGKSNAEWEAEIDAARQHYRLLAEEASAKGDSLQAEDRQHDLEAAIRLARMDLEDLQALKIPSQCKNCNSGQCKKPSQKPAQKKSPKKNAGAGTGPLPDGIGA